MSRGCGDSSCVFATDLSGQRTNGGCRCLRDLSPHTRRTITAVAMEVRQLRGDLEKLREAVEKLLVKSS